MVTLSSLEVEVLQWLLEHGGDVTVCDHDGDTPLHACEDPECAALLLENKADLEATNAEGQTPLDLAVEDERVEMLKWFQEQGMGEGADALTAQDPDEGKRKNADIFGWVGLFAGIHFSTCVADENPENELEHEEWLAQKLAEIEAIKAAEKEGGEGDGDDAGEEV